MASALPPRAPRRSRADAQQRRERSAQLLALFAWHRDTPLVAKSLGLSLDELHAELDDLKLRRKAYRLVRGSDAEIAIVEPVPGAPSGPPVRRRSRRSPTAAAPPAEAPQTPQAPAASQGARPELPPDKRADAQPRFGDRETSGAAPVEDQAAQLRALLAQVGPRRAALAARLASVRHPLSERVLLARFRAAGLEREFGQRERDLLRGLFARHHGSLGAVASALGTDVDTLRRVVRERGLEREFEAARERFRGEARKRRWPREQIEQLVRRRDWLADLGIVDEIQRDVLAKARGAWESAGGSLERLRRELRISERDARALRDLLS